MGLAKCATCGTFVRSNINAKRMSNKMLGWYHFDGLKRDHPAEPADGRTHEEEGIRETALRDQVKAGVRDTLQKQFDYLNAEQRVNDTFRDRR